MIITEQFLKSKTPNESECEDSLFVSEHFAAVIDGVTTKSGIKYKNETSGKACSQLIKKTLENLPVRFTARQAVEYLTAAIYSLYSDLGIEEQVLNQPSERASACIVIYSRYKNEIWMVGDCRCRVDGTCYSNEKSIDSILSEIRSLYLQTGLKTGKSIETFMPVIADGNTLSRY